MMVTGGLTWWKDFICAACYNLLDQRDEVGGDGVKAISRENIFIFTNVIFQRNSFSSPVPPPKVPPFSENSWD